MGYDMAYMGIWDMTINMIFRLQNCALNKVANRAKWYSSSMGHIVGFDAKYTNETSLKPLVCGTN